MKGRESKGPPATDLLVCFPSRAHLSLMPKPICSPARPSDSSTLHRHHRRPSHHHHLRKSSNRGGCTTSHGSPLLWTRAKHNSADISEPTSPKVTCAGQIKVRTKPSSCKNWQSVMEEIERLHSNRKHKKKSTWIEALGFKKDVMQFLTCLRNIRFDFRCFGAIPSSEITSDEEEEEEDEEDEDTSHYRENSCVSKDDGDHNQGSRAVFSKWFMILQEDNLGKELIKAEKRSRGKMISPYCDQELAEDDDASYEQPPPPPPPPNALLLMRCRSAPAKSWLEEREEEEEEISDSEKEEEANKTYFSDKFSYETAKEIGVVGGIQDKISRSRSWRR